mgnify:CR=1 FL=1
MANITKLIRIFATVGGAAVLFACISCSSSRQQDVLVSNVKKNTAQFYSQKAEKAFNERDYQQAVSLFKQALHYTPRSAPASANVGTAFYHSGVLDSALFYFQRSLELNPDYNRAFLNLAKTYQRMANFSEALEAVEELIYRSPENIDAHILQAEILEAQNEIQKAEHSYQAALDLAPVNSKVMMNYAEFLGTHAMNKKAIGLYHRAIEVDPGNAALYYNLGNALARRCKLDSAIDNYYKALELDYTFIQARNNLGLIKLAQGHYSEALEHFSAAERIDGGDKAPLFNLSLAYFQIDSMQTALSFIQRVLDLDSSHARFYLHRGNIYNELGNMQKAESDFHKAIELDSSLAISYNNLANIYQSSGDLQQALNSYRRAISGFPAYLEQKADAAPHSDQGLYELTSHCLNPSRIKADYAMMLNNMGKTLMNAKDWQGALANFKKAMQFQPLLVEPLENMAAVYANIGDRVSSDSALAMARVNLAASAARADSLDDALNYCRQALKIDPNCLKAMTQMGFVFLAMSERFKAEQVFNQALKQDHNNDILFDYAVYQYQLGRDAEALKVLKSIEKQKRNSPDYYSLLTEIYETMGDSANVKNSKALYHYSLGREYEWVGQWERAITEFETAYALNSEHEGILSAMGMIYFKKDWLIEAGMFFQQAIDRDSSSVRAVYGTGLLALKGKDYDRAIRCFNRAVDLGYSRANYDLSICYRELGKPEMAGYYKQLFDAEHKF